MDGCRTCDPFKCVTDEPLCGHEGEVEGGIVATESCTLDPSIRTVDISVVRNLRCESCGTF